MTGEHPKNDPATLDVLSAFNALSRFIIFPESSIKFALDATPNKVPAVSKRLTNRKDITTLIIATSIAPMISNLSKIGRKSGGDETIPLNSINPSNIPDMVTANTPIIIAPTTFLTANISIKRNPRAASNVSIYLKLPKLKNVA